MQNRNKLLIMLGAGAIAITIAVAIIAFVALNLAGDSTTAAQSELPEYAHAIGDPNAPVSIIEFGDFQ